MYPFRRRSLWVAVRYLMGWQWGGFPRLLLPVADGLRSGSPSSCEPGRVVLDLYGCVLRAAPEWAIGAKLRLVETFITQKPVEAFNGRVMRWLTGVAGTAEVQRVTLARSACCGQHKLSTQQPARRAAARYPNDRPVWLPYVLRSTRRSVVPAPAQAPTKNSPCCW